MNNIIFILNFLGWRLLRRIKCLSVSSSCCTSLLFLNVFFLKKKRLSMLHFHRFSALVVLLSSTIVVNRRSNEQTGWPHWYFTHCSLTYFGTDFQPKRFSTSRSIVRSNHLLHRLTFDIWTLSANRARSTQCICIIWKLYVSAILSRWNVSNPNKLMSVALGPQPSEYGCVFTLTISYI